jgi:hypothetical protein|tara:strand:- start:121 stop:381 length:261 start_codon:yes stop_codon:yes gene_type:complete
MMNMKREWEGYMNGINYASVQVFSPRRSVVTDMIMVQFISMIVIFGMVLLLKGGELSTNEVSVFLVGIMVAGVGLGSIYSRITRGQ